MRKETRLRENAGRYPMHYMIPISAPVAGIVGFGMRWMERREGFVDGLPVPGDPMTIGLIALCVLMAAASLVFALMLPAKWEADYDTAFAAEGDKLYATASILAAFLLIGSAALTALGWAGMGEGRMALQFAPLRALLALAGVPAGGCMLFTVKNRFRGGDTANLRFPTLMPGYFACVWLVCTYQRQASTDPILLNYVYELLAVLCILLALYYAASFAFQRPRLRQAVAFSLLGCFLSLVTLADGHAWDDTVRFAAMAVYLAAQAYLLLRNSQRSVPDHAEDLKTEGSSDEQ